MSSWGKIKAVLLTVLLLSQVAFLWGCGAESGLETDPAPGSESGIGNGSESGIGNGSGSGLRNGSGEKILAPLSPDYTVTNPLSIEEHREGEGNSFDYTYVTVTGLRDEAVQQKINDRIKEVYDGLRVQDLPPYRGIRVMVPEGSRIESERIDANVTGNFNHMLSIMLYKETTYQPSGASGSPGSIGYGSRQYISEIETLNFDLNTGEEFALGDLFCDNTAPTEILNTWLSAFLSGQRADEEGYAPGAYWGDIKLVESFKGIGADQKFCVYPDGIGLIFDYLTPQFDTGRRAVMPIPGFNELGETLAVSERFYHEDETDPIFTSESAPVKALIVRNLRRDSLQNAGSEENYADGPVSVSRQQRYSPSLPEKLRLELERMTAVDWEALEGLKRLCGSAKAIPGENDKGYYEILGESFEAGKYINLSAYSHGYAVNQFVYDTEFRCFDKDTLAELGLADLFAAGYDYKPVILKAIREQVIWKENAASSRSKDQMEEAVFRRIRGFNLEENNLRLPVSDPKDEIEQYGMSLSIPYADFGCENLKIFH